VYDPSGLGRVVDMSTLTVGSDSGMLGALKGPSRRPPPIPVNTSQLHGSVEQHGGIAAATVRLDEMIRSMWRTNGSDERVQ